MKELLNYAKESSTLASNVSKLTFKEITCDAKYPSHVFIRKTVVKPDGSYKSHLGYYENYYPKKDRKLLDESEYEGMINKEMVFETSKSLLEYLTNTSETISINGDFGVNVEMKLFNDSITIRMDGNVFNGKCPVRDVALTLLDECIFD